MQGSARSRSEDVLVPDRTVCDSSSMAGKDHAQLPRFAMATGHPCPADASQLQARGEAED